jgi:hypothetical protein
LEPLQQFDGRHAKTFGKRFEIDDVEAALGQL